MEGADVELALDFAAAEHGVALRIHRLIQLVVGIAVAAGVKILAAHHPGQPPIDEVVEARVVHRRFKAQRAIGLAQPDFQRFCGFDLQVRIADVEGRGGVVPAARKQFGRLWRALDILRRHAGNQAIGQVLQQADAAALWRERALLSDRLLWQEIRDVVGRKIRGRALQLDMFDPAGDLRPGRVGEFELVERVAGDPIIIVWIEQAVVERAWIVRAGGRQLLIAALHADRAGDRRKARVEWRELHLNAAFLLLVGKSLAHAVAGRNRHIGKADLVVAIIGAAGPQPDGVDHGAVGAILALDGQLGLARVDPGAVIGAVKAGNPVQRVVLGQRRADEAAIEQIGAADRTAAGLRAGIRLPAVHRIARVIEIGIAGNVVVAALAAIGVGMQRELLGAGIEQHAAFKAAIDGVERGAGFGGDAGRAERFGVGRAKRAERRGAARHRLRNAVVAGADHAADRGRAVAQRRRAADHFDAVGGQRIDRHKMVFAKIGHAAAADAVFDNTDPVDVEAADDRPAGRARRKARSGHAGLGEQQIAERRLAAAADFLVRHHGDGGELIGDHRQDALLRRLFGGDRRCGGSGLSGPRRRLAPGDRARGGDGDFRQRGDGLRQRRSAGPGQQ